jgi:hypothetical protein
MEMKSNNHNTILNEKKVIEKISKIFKCEYLYSGADVFSKLDGFLFKDDCIRGCFEVKVRKQTLSWFEDYKSCMFSFNKIQDGSEVSKMFGIKFFIFIETSDGHILSFQITDRKGRIVCPMNMRYQNLKKTSSFTKGQEKLITSAYLSLEDNPYLKIYKKQN